MRYLRLLVLLGGISVSVHAACAADHEPVASSYFPLAYGNEWVYTRYFILLDSVSVVGLDTVRVDGVAREKGQLYYHLSTPWPPVWSVWIHPDSVGDLYWCDSPGEPEHPLLLFSAEPGSGWLLGGRFCIDSAVRVPCSPRVQDGTESRAGVSCFVGEWRPGDCYDAYWSGVIEERTGPIIWRLVGLSSLVWELVEFRPSRPCDCKCHADPLCDGALDALDLAITIDVAFRGTAPTTDHGCWCYAHTFNGRTDFDCSGSTDVMDVSRIINVVFGGADPSLEFCDPTRP